MMTNSQQSSTMNGHRSDAGSLRAAGPTHAANTRVAQTNTPKSSAPNKKGLALSFKRPPQFAVNRFWSYVEKREPDACWEYHEPSQYSLGIGWLLVPKFHIPGQSSRGKISLSRYAWAIHHGEAPTHMYVWRTCANNLCVNPRHLTLSKRAGGRVAGVSPFRKNTPRTENQQQMASFLAGAREPLPEQFPATPPANSDITFAEVKRAQRAARRASPIPAVTPVTPVIAQQSVRHSPGWSEWTRYERVSVAIQMALFMAVAMLILFLVLPTK